MRGKLLLRYMSKRGEAGELKAISFPPALWIFYEVGLFQGIEGGTG